MSAENASQGTAPAAASACFGYSPGKWPAVVSPFCSDQADDRHAECTLPGCTCACHKASGK